MGIWNRLGSVINSYINDFGSETSGRLKKPYYGDPDVDAAYEELDDFLKQKKSAYEHNKQEKSNERQRSSDAVNLPPEFLRQDFECLQVPFGADEETCKAAYKRLLKIHHPDRHAGHEGNFKKATERSARINASWDKIEKWRKQGGKDEKFS